MYTEQEKEDLFEAVCLRIESGDPLRKILSDKDTVSKTVFYELLVVPAKKERYARACEIRADNIFEDILTISDCEDNDIYIDEAGIQRVNNDVIQRDRLRVDSRKWMLAKMQPKKYGDKLDIDHTSAGEKIESVIQVISSGIPLASNEKDVSDL